MSDPTDYILQLPQSRLPAEDLLSRLTELIISATDADQLTRDVINDTFDVQLETYEEHRADYAARLTPEWNVSIELSSDPRSGPVFEFAFFDRSEGLNAPITEICGFDAAAFAMALTAAGFEQVTTYGVHGGIVGDGFVRGPVQVMTSTRGEAAEPPEKITHRCITSVWVRHRE